MGVHFFLIFALKHRSWVLVRNASTHYLFFFSKLRKISHFSILKIIVFTAVKNWNILHTVMILSFRTDRSGQTVQAQIRLTRLLLEEQSDQRLHCLLFNLHLFDKILSDLASWVNFR